jgi:FkbM family methyltransferase
MNYSTYFKEFRYVMAAPSNWRSRLSLLAATAAFHANNMAKGRPHLAQPIALDLKIGRSRRAVSLRPFSGDIFILYEVLAFESYKIGDTALDPGSVKTIVDCGANIGLTALFFAERYPDARIFCIEPDPENFALLQKNTESEPRITPVQAAIVGSNGGSVFLTQNRPAWGNHISVGERPTGGVEVSGVSMVDLCARYDLQSIDILKVDIEGGEEAMFANPGFLSRVRFVMAELHGAYTFDRFCNDVAPMGFTAKLPAAHGDVRVVTALRVN